MPVAKRPAGAASSRKTPAKKVPAKKPSVRKAPAKSPASKQAARKAGSPSSTVAQLPLTTYSFGVPPTHDLVTFAGTVSAQITRPKVGDMTSAKVRELLTASLREQAVALLEVPADMVNDTQLGELQGGLVEVGYNLSQEEDPNGVVIIIAEARGTVAILSVLPTADVRASMQPLATTIPQALAKFNPELAGNVPAEEDSEHDTHIGLYL